MRRAKDLVVGRTLAVLALLASTARAAAQETPVHSALYGGTLVFARQEGQGYTHDANLFSLRLLSYAPPMWWGVRLAGRGDLTALGFLDPSSLDLDTVRIAEGYAALYRPFGEGVTFGPAVVGGGLVPMSDALAWRFSSTWGVGGRIGRERSWLYVLVGTDGASDRNVSEEGSRMRLLVAGSVEWGRTALVGDWVSGEGGRVRAGLMVRIPVPGGGQ